MAAIGTIACLTAPSLLALVVRWRWVIQAILFQKKPVRAAFTESATLTRGLHWKHSGVLVVVVLISLTLGLAASLLGNVCASVMLAVTGRGAMSLAFSFGTLLLLQTVISTGCSFLGSWVDAGAFTSLYRRRLTALGIARSFPVGVDAGMTPPPRWLAAALPAGLLIFDLYRGGAPEHLLWPDAVPFAPFDMAARPKGGVWILDRDNACYWALGPHFDIVDARQQADVRRCWRRGFICPAAACQ